MSWAHSQGGYPPTKQLKWLELKRSGNETRGPLPICNGYFIVNKTTNKQTTTIKTTLITTYLVNKGLLRCTCEHKLVFTLKCKQVPPGSVWVVLSTGGLCPTHGWLAGRLMNLELGHFLSRLDDAPLAELLVSPHAVD